MTSLHVISGLGPPQSKILATPMNTIMIKCLLFLQRGLNAEKIVVECDIASLNYALFAQSNRLTIQEVSQTYTCMLRIIHRLLCFQGWGAQHLA